MAKQPPAYRKLPGPAANLFGRTRLWQGADHLLVVTSVLAIESYRRFYFREIRAVILQRTLAFRIWNIVLGVLLGPMLAFGAWVAIRHQYTGGYVIALYILAPIALVLLIMVIVNLIRGTTCHTYLQTAAGLERIGAPVRLRSARRLQARLIPLLLAAQTNPI